MTTITFDDIFEMLIDEDEIDNLINSPKLSRSMHDLKELAMAAGDTKTVTMLTELEKSIPQLRTRTDYRTFQEKLRRGGGGRRHGW